MKLALDKEVHLSNIFFILLTWFVSEFSKEIDVKFPQLVNISYILFNSLFFDFGNFIDFKLDSVLYTLEKS